MLPDQVSNPGPLTYESGALPIALCGPAVERSVVKLIILLLIEGFALFKVELILLPLNKTCHRDRIARLTAPCSSHKNL